jgi:uroporphyrinogen decarboxylase
MPVTLTSRDRVARMFARRDQDRVPRFDQFFPETLARWQSEGLAGTPAERFGFDLAIVGDLEPSPYPGRREVISEDATTQTVLNDWGAHVRHWKDHSRSPEYLHWDCINYDLWRDKYKRFLVADNVGLDMNAIRHRYDAARKDHKWTALCCILSFEALKSLMGEATMLMSLHDQPQFITEISHSYTNLAIALFQRILDAGVRFDSLWIYEELAGAQGPICNPTQYRGLIWPDHRRVVDWAHSHGMKIIFHSDGNLTTLLDNLLLAGFDALHPLEAKAGLDIRQLAPKYGKRIALFGNIDMTVAVTNDRARIEAELQTKLAAGKTTKGYFYHSDHSVPPEVSWDTYQFLMQMLDQHGKY